MKTPKIGCFSGNTQYARLKKGSTQYGSVVTLKYWQFRIVQKAATDFWVGTTKQQKRI